jgi:hypothetical protein
MLNGGVLTIDVRNLRNGRDEDGLAGNFIAFAISNTGVGMEAETLQHAFEPFFTTKSEGMGWGRPQHGCRLHQAIGRCRSYQQRDRAWHLGDNLSPESESARFGLPRLSVGTPRKAQH